MSITNNKFLRRFTTAVLTGIMVVSMVGMNVSANEATDEVVTFTKVLDMTEAVGASVPDIEFSYTIEAGEAKSATDTTREIKAGVDADNITISKAVFNHENSVIDNKASKTVTIDFSDVVFEDAGIYRYKITETETNTGVYPDITDDTNRERYLDVYVINDNEGGYEVEYYVLLNTNAAAPNGSDDYGVQNKSEGFTNSYKTYSLSLDKVVSGTMGEKNRTFDFVVRFEGPANAEFTYNGTPVQLNGDGQGSVEIKLADGTEAAVITGIPSTVKYTIEEIIDKGDGYTTTFSVNGTGQEASVGNDKTSSGEITMGAQDNTVVVTNTRDAVNPTGVVMSIMPYALMVALAGVLAFMFLRRRRTNEF